MSYVSHQANIGKWLEETISICNAQYENKGYALIRKVPTDVSFNTRTGRAFYKSKGMVDFVGIAKGKMIAFDTKNTNAESIPFNNIKEHQEDYLLKVDELGGKAFLLIYFAKHKELYRLDIKEYMDIKESLDRKSIPYAYFRDMKDSVKSSDEITFDYLEVGETC